MNNTSKTTKLNPILSALSNTLSAGFIVIPNLIFIGIFYTFCDNIFYVIPYVLLYTIEKCILFFLDDLGEISNPAKISKLGLWIAIIGNILLFFGVYYEIFLSFGAILIAIGLACFSSMYKTTRDAMKNSGYDFGKKTGILGNIFYLSIVFFICFFRSFNLIIVFILLMALLCLNLIFLYTLHGEEFYNNKPAFSKINISISNIILIIALFAFLFFIRLYKQTAVLSFLIYMILGFCFLLFLLHFTHKKIYRPHSYQTSWYGGIFNFIIIYSFIFLTTTGYQKYIMLLFIGITLATILSRKMASILIKLSSRTNKDAQFLCLIFTCISLLILIIPNVYVYLIGSFIVSILSLSGRGLATKKYLEDETININKRHLISSKFSALGAIIQQMILLTSLYISTKIFNQPGESMLYKYIHKLGNLENFVPIWLCCLISIIAQIAIGIFVIIRCFIHPKEP